LDRLIPEFLQYQLWRMMLESNAAEQGARMVAMDNATTNAGELLKNLQLTYNRARQAAITTEVIEISSDAGALKAASVAVACVLRLPPPSIAGGGARTEQAGAIGLRLAGRGTAGGIRRPPALTPCTRAAPWHLCSRIAAGA